MTDEPGPAASFKDHFSDRSDRYARYRPQYPAALFDFVAGLCERRDAAWDCATGNGQAAVALVRSFERVHATDASRQQIEAAMAHERVTYAVAPAEDSALPGASVDLVTVGQALHWFDLPAFFNEAERVLRRGGVLAAWCYQLAFVDDHVDTIVRRLYEDVVGAFWPPERRLIETGYGDIVFPGTAVDTPAFEMRLDWNANDMLGYLGTWSACKRYAAANDKNPLAMIESELYDAWGEGRRAVRWPLKLRVCRL